MLQSYAALPTQAFRNLRAGLAHTVSPGVLTAAVMDLAIANVYGDICAGKGGGDFPAAARRRRRSTSWHGGQARHLLPTQSKRCIEGIVRQRTIVRIGEPSTFTSMGGPEHNLKHLTSTAVN